jgi:hypothetical protein
VQEACRNGEMRVGGVNAGWAAWLSCCGLGGGCLVWTVSCAGCLANDLCRESDSGA